MAMTLRDRHGVFQATLEVEADACFRVMRTLQDLTYQYTIRKHRPRKRSWSLHSLCRPTAATLPTCVAEPVATSVVFLVSVGAQRSQSS